jgi:hypothetical protein
MAEPHHSRLDAGQTGWWHGGGMRFAIRSAASLQLSVQQPPDRADDGDQAANKASDRQPWSDPTIAVELPRFGPERGFLCDQLVVLSDELPVLRTELRRLLKVSIDPGEDGAEIRWLFDRVAHRHQA